MPKLSPVKVDIFVKFLLHVGCKQDNREHVQKRKGGHLKFHRLGLARPIIVQGGKREIHVMAIRSNLKTLGIPVETFLQIISDL